VTVAEWLGRLDTSSYTRFSHGSADRDGQGVSRGESCRQSHPWRAGNTCSARGPQDVLWEWACSSWSVSRM